MDRWYREKAEELFAKIFLESWRFFKKRGVKKPILKLRRMKARWGSLSTEGRMTLNLNLIQADKECIEYVIFHELCHLYHYNHSADFYKLLSNKMPDWLRRKKKLELTGIVLN